MRARGSVSGPVIIILIGIVFLIHALHPELRILDFVAVYWPYLLIVWGVLAFLEVTLRFLRGSTIPVNGISSGSWVVIVVISLAGASLFEIHQPGHWWSNTDWGRGFNEAFLGDDHEYSIELVQKTVGAGPHIILENFRGDAKVTGIDGNQVSLSGHKSIRSVETSEAERANQQTPVEMTVRGNTVTIRCHQDQAGARAIVTSNLELSVPKGASLEATGTAGDFDISSLAGDVDLSSANAGVHLDDIGGNVKVDTRQSDIVRCTNVKGTVELRGHGTDVEVTKADREVNINGDYSGTVSLRELAKPVRVENLRTILNVESVPGEIRLDRGSLNAENIVGPVKLTAHSTDVSIDGWQNGLNLALDRGDIDLRPGHLPLANMVVRTRSGNIELALPETAKFQVTASTDHGDIDNEFGDSLKEQTSGSGARLEGSIGSGPDVSLTTERGSITLRKSSESKTGFPPAGTDVTATRTQVAELAAVAK
ncbi:MAG: DUF4097 family beta strand repeat protein [Acidobacteriaceae bacterium]|nr:DUF4097 family beta strand repeat protein [Acidobacteriaceae bacterium]